MADSHFIHLNHHCDMTIMFIGTGWCYKPKKINNLDQSLQTWPYRNTTGTMQVRSSTLLQVQINVMFFFLLKYCSPKDCVCQSKEWTKAALCPTWTSIWKPRCVNRSVSYEVSIERSEPISTKYSEEMGLSVWGPHALQHLLPMKQRVM